MVSNKVAISLHMSISFWIFCLCLLCVVTNSIVLASIVLYAIVIWSIQTRTWLITLFTNVSTPTYLLLPPSNFTSVTSNFSFACAIHNHKSSSPIIQQTNQTKLTNYGASHQQQTLTLNPIIHLHVGQQN
jgi:hypothetical protein